MKPAVGILVFFAFCIGAFGIDTRKKQLIAVKLTVHGERDAENIASMHGFQYYKSITGLKGYHLFYRDITERTVPHTIDENEHVLWSEIQVPKQRTTRKINVNAVKKSVQNYRVNPDTVPMKERELPQKKEYENEPASYAEEEAEELQQQEEEEEGVTFVAIKGEEDGVPNDPMLLNGDQWHLVNPRDLRDGSAFFLGSPINVNILDAWRQGYTGQGVTVAVVDDGIDYNHPDIGPNFADTCSTSINFDSSDPMSKRDNSHGTAAAGLVAAAAGNNVCGVGVAYNAKISGVQLLATATTDSEEAMALAFRCQPPAASAHFNHIFSNSWGPIDSGKHVDGPGHLTKLAMKHCSENGRNGLGSVYVWAGGNGRNSMDNSNYDGFANSIYTIAVGAADDYGDVSWYSEPGANILVVAPSSDGPTNRRISTTDLKGRRGASFSDCRSDFGGTSAAAPQVAGIVATMFSANPMLTKRDVEHILVRTANRRVLRRNLSPWITNTAGNVHSDDFGFGLVDASAAVELASRWTTVKTQTHLETPYEQMEVPLRAGSIVELHHNISTSVNNMFLEHVRMSVRVRTPMGHGYISIQLCSPTGTCSILQNSNPGREHLLEWEYDTVKHWGENIVDRRSQRSVKSVPSRLLKNAQPLYWSYEHERLSENGSVYVPHNTWYARIANTYNVRSEDAYILGWKLDFYGYTVN